MSLYRKIEVSMYSDGDFNALSPMQPSGQSLWIYLLTGPHTGPIPGLFVSGPAAMAEALRWSRKAYDRCLAEILEKGMVKIDTDSRLFWVPNAIKYNKPESPNVVLHWANAFMLIPECPLRDEAVASMKVIIEGMGENFLKAFDKVFGKVIGKPFIKASGKAIGKASGKAMPNQLTVNSKQLTVNSNNTGTPEEKPPAEAFPPGKVDPLYHKIRMAFETVSGRFADYAREGVAIKRIIKFTEGNESKVGQMIETFYNLTKSQDRFWSGQPFLPSILSSGGIWPRVLVEVQKSDQVENVDWYDKYVREAQSEKEAVN